MPCAGRSEGCDAAPSPAPLPGPHPECRSRGSSDLARSGQSTLVPPATGLLCCRAQGTAQFRTVWGPDCQGTDPAHGRATYNLARATKPAFLGGAGSRKQGGPAPLRARPAPCQRRRCGRSAANLGSIAASRGTTQSTASVACATARSTAWDRDQTQDRSCRFSAAPSWPCNAASGACAPAGRAAPCR